ncbi:glutaminyl-peptide cyclotransferase [Subsaximicrobium wynnwilliamsii]|uniref:Glutaminyl-peptide cyclotransferase n=1 Tax=Subsaximicrobium wynnwilliamsii TaxID=291179 RepID=A0A5C6ZIX1_9FLAO|nr:glutaminyl-peptide cyclotransferase [Subsaximicrobium wynnwilliamsii]TXD84222.1 glutaminyl-peptide cyclotransferase [Subsaximicrobium wynnwilliamsii]TXD89843.1 glutaminyl-peptide cyclotransferase [Subsaximicrobium wynnwilliamsii]TXE03934.1 glutaminyl-peptide cyclotransferase [Subsaximicrobium wynnwilliamsii]
MISFKSFILISLSLLFINCGNQVANKSRFEIKTNAKEDVISLGETLNLSLKNPKNVEISAVSYQLNGKSVGESITLANEKLGQQTLTAIINTGDSEEKINTQITILNNKTPEIYGFKIINEYPHDITSYTQGLEFHKGELYESTGQYKESKLRKVDYKTGEVLKNIDLADQYFAEGITILDHKIYQLTWQENTGFVYDVETFEKINSFKYGKSEEGWGLCQDGKVIYKSDGTEDIWTLDPETLEEISKTQVYTNKGKIVGINEMEWINGKIYANRYQKNGVAIINPVNGAVEAVIDFSPLHNMVTQHKDLDVLNGIAYNPETKTIFVTGKRWDKLFEVEVFKK